MSELEEYRDQIDEVDKALSELFLRRMAITEQVGRYKLEHRLPVLDAARERRVVEMRTAATEDPERRADLSALYESIMAISRRQQRRLVHEGAEDRATPRGSPTSPTPARRSMTPGWSIRGSRAVTVRRPPWASSAKR